MKKWTLLVLVMGAGCCLAHAQESPWRVYVAGGLATGGDTVFSGVIVEDGTNKKVPFDIKPGTGIPLRLGAEYRLLPAVALRGAVERTVTDPMGYNGSATFTRTSTELMGLYSLSPAIRLGAGVRQTTGVLQGTGVAANLSQLGTYTSAGGAVVEAQYLFYTDPTRPQSRQPQVAATLRLVSESLKRDDITLSGDHYEVGLALYF